MSRSGSDPREPVVTGFSAEDFELFESAFGADDAPNCLVAPNFAMAAARTDDFAADPTEHEVYPGARGGLGPKSIRVHRVRMRGMVAHQEVVLGSTGQTLTIRQHSYDRDSFMPGVVPACARISEFPGLTRALDPFVD